MRPILLKGHDRSITHIAYNREGDLIFSASKGTSPSVCYADNGERIGTYKGHNGAVWSLDVNRSTTRLLTGSADNCAKIWDVETGRELQHFQQKIPVRSVAFGLGDRSFLYVTDQVMGQLPAVFIYKLEDESKKNPWKLAREIPFKGRANAAKWGNLNQTIYVAGEEGVLVFDAETGQQINHLKDHKKSVNSIKFARDYSCFITASSDHTAKLWDAKTNTCLKTYETDRPVNDAEIAPNCDVIVLGGGQEADKVTTSHTRVGQFQVRFFHKIFEEELCTVKGHFGPINALAFSPDGKSFSSGAEDGFVRIHNGFESEFKKSFSGDYV